MSIRSIGSHPAPHLRPQPDQRALERYDEQKKKRYKTVELIEAEVDSESKANTIAGRSPVEIRQGDDHT